MIDWKEEERFDKYKTRVFKRIFKNWEDFCEKFQVFHKKNISWFYTAENCKKQAEKFSEEIFEKKLLEIIKNNI